jgi:hypothetical protein
MPLTFRGMALNGLILVLLNSLPALLAPCIAFRSEFKARR